MTGKIGPAAEDITPGGDADMPGLDQPISRDDIEALLHSPRYGIEQRREILNRWLADMRARATIDLGHDLDEEVRLIEEALRSLDQPPDVEGVAGMDPDDKPYMTPDDDSTQEEK